MVHSLKHPPFLYLMHLNYMYCSEDCEPNGALVEEMKSQRDNIIERCVTLGHHAISSKKRDDPSNKQRKPKMRL